MKSNGLLLTAAGCLGAIVVLGQTPAPTTPAAPQQGPGVQAPLDARYANLIASKCKTPPQPAGGGRGGRGRGAPANTAPEHREYTVKEIPGVIAAGAKWKSVWTGTGNNADGIIPTKDGGILAAQNTNSDVMEIDKDGKVSFPYKDTNTGGALSMNKKGALFVVERGIPTSVVQLVPKRQTVADSMNGEPLECIGGTINDLTAANDGTIYFTMGGLFRINPKGVVTREGTIGTVQTTAFGASTNGVALSPDEKTLYVTGLLPASIPKGEGGTVGGGLVAYDIQPDGSLKNERQFATVASALDGTVVDAMGRIYSTGGNGIQVFSPDGKSLGEIPAPLNLITATFSGPDKKTLYAVANNQRFDEIFTIQMTAQGYKGRPK
jgi:gluconolactonase